MRISRKSYELKLSMVSIAWLYVRVVWILRDAHTVATGDARVGTCAWRGVPCLRLPACRLRRDPPRAPRA